MSERAIAVVTAGLGVPSSTRLLADRLAAATAEALAERGDTARLDVIELREHARALADHLLTGIPGAGLRAAIESVTSADGLVVVTPVFSASYSGLFKTFFDVLEDGAIAGTPVLLAATAGTARHSLVLDHAMRPLFAHLRAVTVPTAVLAAAEDWAGGDAATAALAGRVRRAAGELARLVATREPFAVPDPFTDPTPFDELLRGA